MLLPTPASATRIRYIESTGTQWIDTGVQASSPVTVALRYAIRPGGETNNALFGAFEADASGGRLMLFITKLANGKNRIQINPVATSATAYAITDVEDDTVHRLEVHFGADCWWRVDGGSKTTKTGANTTVGSRTLWICNRSSSDAGRRNPIKARIYSAEIYDASGSLVRSFVPMRVGQSGYLFDRVSGQLFGNVGTGDFVLGPDTFSQGVVPTRMMVAGVRKKPIEVGCITSNGNVVVPLDFVFTSNNITAKHTFIGSVSGAWSDGSQYQSMLFCSQYVNAPSNMSDAEKGGFRFMCSNPDRRHQIYFGVQGWWNYANRDNYSYDQFHTFVFQRTTSLRQFGTYTRDGTSVTMVASSIYGNNTTSNLDPTYNDRPVVLFGRYDYNTGSYGYFDVNSWKFGGWKIELNGQVVHEYVPAVLNGTVGVWDKVTNRFFKSVGSGQLTFGDR